MKEIIIKCILGLGVLLFVLSSCKKNSDVPSGALAIEPTVEFIQLSDTNLRVRDRIFVKAGGVALCKFSWDSRLETIPPIEVQLDLVDPQQTIITSYRHKFDSIGVELQKGKRVTYCRYFHIPISATAPTAEMVLSLHDPVHPESKIPFLQKGVYKEQQVVSAVFIAPVLSLMFQEGWNEPESSETHFDARWLSRTGAVDVPNPEAPFFLTIQGTTLPECFPQAPHLTVSVSKTELQTFSISQSPFELQVPVSYALIPENKWIRVDLTAHESFTPAECHNSPDNRSLSFFIQDISLSYVRYKDGWYEPERKEQKVWRWASPKVEIDVVKPKSCSKIVLLAETNSKALNKPLTLQASIADTRIASQQFTSNEFIYEIPITAASVSHDGIVTVSITADASFSPAESGLSEDTRALTYCVYDILVVPCIDCAPGK